MHYSWPCQHTHTPLPYQHYFFVVLHTQKQKPHHKKISPYILSQSLTHRVSHTQTVWLTISLHMENRTLKRVSSAHRQSSVPLSPYKVHIFTYSVLLEQWKDKSPLADISASIKSIQVSQMSTRRATNWLLENVHRWRLRWGDLGVVLFPPNRWIIYVLIKT